MEKTHIIYMELLFTPRTLTNHFDFSSGTRTAARSHLCPKPCFNRAKYERIGLKFIGRKYGFIRISALRVKVWSRRSLSCWRISFLPWLAHVTIAPWRFTNVAKAVSTSASTAGNNINISWSTTFCWHPYMRGWSHRPIHTPSVGISVWNSLKSGGHSSIFQHNPQQFHSWNRMEILVWARHEFQWVD